MLRPAVTVLAVESTQLVPRSTAVLASEAPAPTSAGGAPSVDDATDAAAVPPVSVAVEFADATFNVPAPPGELNDSVASCPGDRGKSASARTGSLGTPGTPSR